MMRFRWLSTFTTLGALLIVLGIVGLVRPHFVYDPGQIATGREALCYLLVGILMVANGLLAPSQAHEDTREEASKPARPSEPTSIAVPAAKPGGD